MSESSFERALYHIGERDAARELYREQQAKRQERKRPKVWGYRGTGKRGKRR